MDNEKKVIDMEQGNGTVPVIVEPKKSMKEKAKAWWDRNKKKILIGGVAVLTAGGMAAAKAYKDRKEEEAAQTEAERNALAEEWFQKGLEEARASAPAIPEAVDVDYEPVESVE